MIDYSKTLNVDTDGVAHGRNHMFHFETGDPFYDDYHGFGYLSEQQLSTFGIGQPTSTCSTCARSSSRRGK